MILAQENGHKEGPSMTGYDEAAAWLKANASEWILTTSDSRLVSGSLDQSRYTVRLVERDAQLKAHMGSGYVTLEGEGATMLEAVQNAVGGLR